MQARRRVARVCYRLMRKTVPLFGRGSIGLVLAVTLTINGQPLPVEVDVYRLSRPVVELQQQDPDQEPAAAPSSRRTILFWTGIGSAVGCFGGAVAGDGDNSRSGNCIIWGGIGTAIGAIIGKVVATDEGNTGFRTGSRVRSGTRALSARACGKSLAARPPR